MRPRSALSLRGHVTAMGDVCSGHGGSRDGGCVSIGAAARRCAVFQQQERHVIVGVTGGVLVHGSHAMPLRWLEIRPRPGNQGAVKLSPLDALPEPANLGRLKKVIIGRWAVPLIDVLKEAVRRCGITPAGWWWLAGRVASG
jgi:hypothetical protein